MNLYGLMITKDDEPIFADWCREQLPLYDAVVCLDGSAGPATAHVAARYPGRLVYLHERDFTIAHKTDHGLRRVVHQEIVRRFGAGHWVMCCHADEFCYHDPRQVASKAQREGYDAVSWYSLHFYPHPTERDKEPGMQARPIPERFRYYHWDYRGSGLPWREDRLYRDGPGVAWDGQTHGSAAPQGLRQRAPFCPILRHYKVLTMDLAGYDRGAAAAHYRTHWQELEHRTGLPFRVERPEDLYVAAVPGYGRCDRFDGRIDQPWNMGEAYRPAEAHALRALR
jgi:hypothetical protein